MVKRNFDQTLVSDCDLLLGQLLHAGLLFNKLLRPNVFDVCFNIEKNYNVLCIPRIFWNWVNTNIKLGHHTVHHTEPNITSLQPLSSMGHIYYIYIFLRANLPQDDKECAAPYLVEQDNL